MSDQKLKELGFNLEPKKPDERWVVQKSILAGVPKCGKSTFLAQGGKTTWFFRLAHEFNDLTTYGVDCKDFNDVQKEVTKLFKAQAAKVLPFDTIVFDPADRILEYIAQDICENNGVDSIADMPHGKGWNEYKKAIKCFVYGLDSIEAHKFFCFHTVSTEMPEPNNPKKTYTKEIISLSQKTESAFAKWVDNIFHVKTGYVGAVNARTMVTQGTKFVEAGSKMTKFKKMPTIPWGDDDKVNYDKFRGLFK